MPSRSQLVCQLCVTTSMHQQCDQHDVDSIPTKASCRAAVPWENVPTEHSGRSEQGRTYQWGALGVGEQDLPGQQLAGYQCGFCVNAAGPAVQTLCPRVALHQDSAANQIGNTNKGIFCQEQPFGNRLSAMYKKLGIFYTIRPTYMILRSFAKFHKGGCE